MIVTLYELNSSDLKQFRKKFGLTQKELAKLIGVATHTIKQYEMGRRKIPKIVTNFLTILQNFVLNQYDLTD